MFRKERGITLVALVVTIVVLLILAGISLSLVLGQNGIVTRAKESRNAQSNALIMENEEYTNVLKEMNSMLNTSTTPGE